MLELKAGSLSWSQMEDGLEALRRSYPTNLHVLGSLSSSFEGVMALYRMMKGQGGEPALTGPALESAASGAADEITLRGMMRDPRYWRERDPSYVAQVTSGFQRMYGEQ